MTTTPPQGAQSADPVREAAQALIDRYHAPSWKDGVPFVEFIQRLSTALAAPEGPAPTDPLDDAPVHASYKRMFEAAVVSLAEIDRLLGVEPDGCNDPETTVSALKDYIAGTTDAINARNEFVDAQYAAPEAPPPVEARQPEPEGQKLARMWLATHYTDEYDARDIEAMCWKILGHETAPDDLEAVAIIEGQPRATPLADWQKRAIDIGFNLRWCRTGASSTARQRSLDTPARVRFYEHDFYPLSNFSAFTLEWKDRRFDTSEAAYHWEKFVGNPTLMTAVQYAPSAHEAFKVAERNKPFRRADWDDVKVSIMRDILRAKAAQHEYVRRKLLATGDRELVEDSWRDDFWGWGPNRDGQNMLGKLWMEVRAELRNASPAATSTRKRTG